MGNVIKWKQIDPIATYNQARIYRAAVLAGPYSLIATVSILDGVYYDQSGTTSMWYKVDFYDSIHALASEQSDPIQGGTYRYYCTPEDVRSISSIATGDLTDTQLANLIEFAAMQINADIQIYFEEEKIFKINEFKNNVINNTNAIFWTRNWPIGDLNDDQMVDTSDVVVWQYNTDNTRTQLAVDSINPDTGQITLVAAPQQPNILGLTVTYKKAALSVSKPHPLVKMACATLSCAWAYTKLNVGKAPKWAMGSTKIWRDMDSFKTFYSKYIQLLTEIANRSNMDLITGTGYPGSESIGNVTVDTGYITRGN